MANYNCNYCLIFSNKCNVARWYALVSVILLVLSQLTTSIGEPLKIRPKLCNNALGEEGTCMFVWECIKTEGRHLGTCVDGFLFGSCCGHNESSNSINSVHDHIPDLMVTSATVVDLYPVTSTTTKEKHKNKWKPTTVTTTSVPVTEQPIHSSVISVWAINRNTTRPNNTSIPIVPYKPATTPKPWFIYTVKKPVFASTHRPAYIAVVPTSRPPVHFPQSTNFPNRNPLPSPTTASSIQLSSNLIVSQSSTKYPPIPSTATEPSTVSPSPSTIAEPVTNAMTFAESSTATATPSMPAPQSPQHSSSQITDTTRPSNTKDQCGVTQLRPKTKVVGGKNSAFGAWPWQVSVRRTSFFGFSSTHRCGGAILNSEWIATAGHCVDDLLLTQIRIRLGEYDFSSALEPLPHIERGAKKKVVHPKYNFFTYENDLALVQLDQPIEYLPHVASICLPPDNIELLGRNATVTGWGRLSEGGVLPTVLQEVRVPIVSNDKCKNMFLSAGRHEYIPDIFMCAGFDEGGHDSCQGDSGGPLQVQGDDGRWFLAGIISWGIGCGEPSLPGVCTRITKFKQWILSYISN